MINCIDSYQLINPNIKYYENLEDCSKKFKLFSSTFFCGKKKKRGGDDTPNFTLLLGKRSFHRKKEERQHIIA